MLGGGPLKQVGMSIAKVAADGVMQQGHAWASAKVESAISDFVTDLGWSADLKFAGMSVHMAPSDFGGIAGQVGGALVDALFDRGMDALLGRARGMTGIVGLVQDNAATGRSREIRVQSRLEGAFPNARVQRETYLRNADGTRAVDPITGEARRIDHAVIDNGKVRALVETTSPTADKTEQIAKEVSIRSQGSVYIRDRVSGELLEASGVQTRIIRVK